MPRIKICLTGPNGRIMKTIANLPQKGHFLTDFVINDQKFTLTLDHISYKIVDQVVQGFVKAAIKSGKPLTPITREFPLSKSSDVDDGSDTCTDRPEIKI